MILAELLADPPQETTNLGMFVFINGMLIETMELLDYSTTMDSMLFLLLIFFFLGRHSMVFLTNFLEI